MAKRFNKQQPGAARSAAAATPAKEPAWSATHTKGKTHALKLGSPEGFLWGVATAAYQIEGA